MQHMSRPKNQTWYTCLNEAVALCWEKLLYIESVYSHLCLRPKELLQGQLPAEQATPG